MGRKIQISTFIWVSYKLHAEAGLLRGTPEVLSVRGLSKSFIMVSTFLPHRGQHTLYQSLHNRYYTRGSFFYWFSYSIYYYLTLQWIQKVIGFHLNDSWDFYHGLPPSPFVRIRQLLFLIITRYLHFHNALSIYWHHYLKFTHALSQQVSGRVSNC